MTIRERPILFSAPMARAILEGRKTQTRRVFKRAIDGDEVAGSVHPAAESGWIAWFPGNVSAEKTKELYRIGIPCPHGLPGDKLWVRETHWINKEEHIVAYRADGEMPDHMDEPWRPSIFMPRWASRLTLEITDIRVERLQDISEEDAKAEGVGLSNIMSSYQRDFQFLWNSINAKRGFGWDVNPWVWAVSFRRITNS